MSRHAGVSVHMSMNYFSPTPGGQDCEIDAHVTKAGRTLAFAEVEIRNKKTGKVTARGTHIKFIPPMPNPSAPSNGKLPPGTPKAAATPEAADQFVSDMVSKVREGFDPDATQNFEATALYGLKDITATEGQVICSLPVSQRVQNVYNTLHGGCIGKSILSTHYVTAVPVFDVCACVSHANMYGCQAYTSSLQGDYQ